MPLVWNRICLCFFFMMTFLASVHTDGRSNLESLGNSTDQCPNVKTSLDSLRKRRHLTFPDKSVFVITLSLLKALMTHAPSGWNLSLEIDVIYSLPDARSINAHYRRKLHHRQKRRFWQALQGAIDIHNLNGRSCILRSICEVNSKVAPIGSSLVHDLMRAIFSAPLDEEGFKDEVKDTYNELLDPKLCDQPNDCPFSMIHFIMSLNKYAYK